MDRRILRTALTAALVAAFGSGCGRSEALIIGEGFSDSPTPLPMLSHPPIGTGGGPSGECHDDPDLDLGEPVEVPEGYEEGDDSESSPAHPLHLRQKKKPGVEDNI